IYPSPMADFGYDISDYQGIHPLFGTMADFEELLQAAHNRGIKIILDLVPNHTSHQHPWFVESKSSKDNPKRDWYIWKNAHADGSPPNNWLSVFGGTAWEWDETTGQYYYHAFLKEQPDLNWRNPEVQKAMLDVMRFWLEKGVDGFRVDVLWHLIKDEQLRNNPINPTYQPHQATYEQLLPVYSTDQPEVHEMVQQMRQLLDEYEERMMIGEIYLPIHKLVAYYGIDNNGAHLPFNFMMIALPWEARRIATAIDEYEGALPKEGWPNWVLGNHDQPRITSRVGLQQSKVAAMLLLTLRGTPTIYYGDELGMRDVPIPPEEVQDPQGLNMPGKNLSRDPARTPMVWDNSEGGGFTKATPWLRLGNNYKRVNVAAQKEEEGGHLQLYKR
ncbi:MAG: alpha-amylase family glycosyl hydrolase, partial [Eubacterium aggregans]